MTSFEPKAVFSFFEEICRIPRESGHEQEMTAYLIRFAKQHQLPYKTDSIGNVVISKPASAGMENRPGIVLQSHTDMVCEKNSDVCHNFATDPIRFYAQDGWLRACGTTLGADDGIGVAAQLSVLDSDTLEHGPIECLFTVSEETGLDGANALKNAMLDGRILLNLDSEDEGEVFIGCAGGIDTTARFHYYTEAADPSYTSLEVKISGLTGGHSGDDINKGRANAVQLLARFLWQIQQKTDLRIASISGGNKRNAIAREAHAVCSVPQSAANDFVQCLKDNLLWWKHEYHASEPNMTATVEVVANTENWIEKDCTNRLISALYASLHGILAMSADVPGLVETSTNLASVKMDQAGIIRIGTSQRSAIDSSRYDASSRVEAHFRLAGAEVSHESQYPGWAPNPSSRILKTSVAAYSKLFGKEPVVRAIHAGLECGLFLKEFPDMDMISFGPTLRGVHSPDECLEISTVQKFWDFLLEILRTA